MKISNIQELEKIACNIRKNIINEVYSAKSGHPGPGPAPRRRNHRSRRENSL